MDLYLFISCLLGAIFLVSWIQPTKQRRISALVASIPTCWHHIGYLDVQGFAYYASAAVIDAGMIIALSFVRPVCALAIRLQVLCVISIALNTLGWILWQTGYVSTLYDGAYVIFYSYMLAIMIKRGYSKHVGDNTASGRRFDNDVSLSARDLLDPRNKGTV